MKIDKRQKTKVVGMWLDEKSHNKLKSVSKKFGYSVSGFVRYLAEYHLDKMVEDSEL